jgi:hypothetical protein
MDERPTRNPPFGMLLCGMIIGLALGTIAAKRDHFVLWMIIGPILGTVAGLFLQAWWIRRHP